MTDKSHFYQPLPKGAIAFRAEFLDFRHGIRVGNLEDNERITRLLKIALEHRYRQPFVTERWGRGVYWQWIGCLPRANRDAKPASSHVSFGCAKYFLMVDTADKLFKCGLQVERGYLTAPPEYRDCQLAPDWDWHRLLHSLKQRGPMERELNRLVVDEGFTVHGGSWDADAALFDRSKPPDLGKLRKALRNAPGDRWAGFQVFYPMREREVQNCTGVDLVEAMLAVFDEVTPAMNLCMQIDLHPARE
jgi:hypothetical protein